MEGCLTIFGGLMLIGLAISCWPITIVIMLAILGYKAYESKYFKSEEFLNIKTEISSYIKECNELNSHIENLKDTDDLFDKKDYGVAETKDRSKYNFSRKELEKFSNAKQVYNCSLNVCRSAQKKPFEYICKYFNISKDESSLEFFEEMLNNFLAVKEGRVFLADKKKKLMDSIEERIPRLIKKFSNQKLENELGFENIDFSTLYYPSYTLQYISDGGNSSMETKVTLDEDNLERFVAFLNDHIQWKNSIKGQRALMTASLRKSIKERDHYTCCKCSNSTEKEPNLLLEIDHILPLSKGGITEVNNLQTLCWKCNRSKGAKIETSTT